MAAAPGKVVRCAIYTRVSTDAGLDQEFNSLDAQFDAAQAYIRSQAHAGWSMIRTRYDDGGFSGGSTDRPALQQLLADIRNGKVNVIVVYKVDRLTRSLADFAKLVELFDSHGVSFVSVTQQFNTTTSMGRLTLNVLLSFAQFEREVTSERIRDKIGASKRKGLWVGGVVPLGYHARDRKIAIVESEAGTVRHIFRRYLELGSLNLLLSNLRADGVTTRVRNLTGGRTVGGIPFTRGPLAYLLRNRFYIGEVRYKGEVFPGEQPPILDRELFDAVQVRLEQQRTNHTAARHASDSILMGLIFDDDGQRMTPTYAVKNGVRYRYYISAGLNQGGKAKATDLSRVPAIEIEALIASAVRKRLGLDSTVHTGSKSMRKAKATDLTLLTDKSLIAGHVLRVDVKRGQLAVTLKLGHESQNPRSETCETGAESIPSSPGNDGSGHMDQQHRDPVVTALLIPWIKKPSKLPREIIRPSENASRSDHRPIRAETRAKLVAAIAKGRLWLDEIVAGNVVNVEHIAKREKCSIRQVNRIITLAFLAPDLVQAAIDGRLPRGVGIESLRDCPVEWHEQHRKLGLAS
jgi:DNA invertase Pin-like site-specific DNA recombinase